MKREISDAVQRFFDRCPYARSLGRVTSAAEFEALPKKVNDAIPEWYKDLLIEFPIANLPLGIPYDFGQPLLKNKTIEQLPLLEVTFHSVNNIGIVSETKFPSYLLFQKKIIEIAEEYNSTGEGIFIDAKRTNPPVILIIHDNGITLNELIKTGDQLSSSFSGLFDFGKLVNERIKLTDENKLQAISLIEDFFNIIDNSIQINSEEMKMNLMDPKLLTGSIEQRKREIKNEEYVLALLKQQYGLYDSGYPLTIDILNKLIDIYKTCNLHIPELIYIEERVSNNIPLTSLIDNGE